MKKSEFKQMIKESVKEVLVEEGVLKSVISEVVKAVGTIQTEQPPATTQQSFIKKVKKEGIQDEWRERHMYFEKPTDKRRRKRKERNRVIKKLQREYDAKYKD